MRHDGGADMKIVTKFTQGSAQALFNDRVVERHFQHVGNRHALLHRPGQQVRDVFGVGAEHFSP